MLTYISVKNFAIIENMDVTFYEGMTAVTGETGAGKSLLIDAIGLLLGDRATSNIVRSGSNKAIVEGVFHTNNKQIHQILQDLDIETDHNELVIHRQITPTNNNIIKINNHVVTLKDLRDITTKLADIHTQLDTHRLINQETYLEIIDGFEHHPSTLLIHAYQLELEEYKKERLKLKRLQTSNNDLIERLDLMKYQQKELEGYHLDPVEEEELLQEVEKMENFDKIYQTLQTAKQRIEENDALGAIYDSAKMISDIADLSTVYQDIMARMESYYYDLDDVFESLKQEINRLDFNPQLLDEYQDRLSQLDSLKRKYRKTIPEIIEYLAEITEDIENVEHYDDVIARQAKVVEQQFNNVVKEADKLTALRMKTAIYIETELLRILTDLELPKTSFKVVFEPRKELHYTDGSLFLERGMDEVDFLLSTNVGEPLKPLSKSASGGEMSRIMLGFKSLLASSLGLSLMIFDEIDTGVSGFIAFQVAKKMKQIAQSTQVICITHIPQVAAISEHHIKIMKQVTDGRTVAYVEELNDETRINEIAGMMSGDTITEATITSATELLNQ